MAEVIGARLPDDFHLLARELIESVLPVLADLRSLRAQAYIVLAWGHLWMQGVQDIDSLEQVAWRLPAGWWKVITVRKGQPGIGSSLA